MLSVRKHPLHIAYRLKAFTTTSVRNLQITHSNMEKFKEKMQGNPYYNKYADKINQLHQTSPEEFLTRAERLSIMSDEKNPDGFSKVASKAKKSLPSSAYAFAPQKKLSSIMKTELLEDKTPEEIKYIWTEYFMKREAISGVMSLDLFEKIQERAVKYPMFIFPLPRNEGYEFIYAQFAANEVHFTPLVNYQTYQENAPECLTIIHYPDLAQEKGIVLMHGEVNKDILNTMEAQFLANQIVLYYGTDDSGKLNLVREFHENPNEFKSATLIEQLEKIDLASLAKKDSSSVNGNC